MRKENNSNIDKAEEQPPEREEKDEVKMKK